MNESERETRLNDGQGLEIATWEDFGIEYGDDGELKPVTQRVPGSDYAIRVRPVIDVEPVADVLEQPNPDDDRVDEVAEKHIVEGPGADGNLSDGPDYVIVAILQAIKGSSGNEYRQATEKQRLQEEAELMNSVGMDNLQDLAEIGQDSSTEPP